MRSFIYLAFALLWHFASTSSECPHDPNTLEWTSVDCEKMQIPYGINSIVPKSPGLFTPPEPLPMAPTKLNPTLRQAYYTNISSILASTKKTAGGGAGSTTDCQQCTSTFQTLHLAAQQLSPADITSLLTDLCTAGYQLFDSESCQNLYAGSASEGPYLAKLFYLLDETTLDIQAFCVFNKLSNCSPLPVVKIKESDWFTPKPTQSSVAPASGNTVGVVHMSDFHLDTRYTLGSKTGCRDPGVAGSGASRWGIYDCDSPGDLVLSAFSTMKSLINMDEVAFSIFTGDIVNHDDDVQLSEEYVTSEEQNVFDAFKAEMKNCRGDIPLYASLGNHDSYPEMYANSDSSWNYDFLSALWQKNNWIGSDAAEDVKTHFGAYAVSNLTGLDGLKVISINTDFWYVYNIFNYANYTNPDPNGMLKFLITELEAAEAANQRVWIVGHVPSGYSSGSALPNPTALFQSIVVRFSPSTIAAIFWGHTHWDQKLIYYDFASDSMSQDGQRDTSKIDLTKPLNVGWIGPSLTPTAGSAAVNPAWSYYTIDTATYSITNAQTYYVDISNASWSWESMDGKWAQLYDARKTYDPDSLSPKEPLDAGWWDTYLAKRIENDGPVAQAYNQYEVRDYKDLKKCTSQACLTEKRCNIQAGTAEAALACTAQGSANSPS